MKSRLEQLQNLEIDVSPVIWKNIERDLPSERKHRFLFWIFTLGGLSILAGLFFISNRSVQIDSHQSFGNSKEIQTQYSGNKFLPDNKLNNTSVILSVSENRNDKKKSQHKLNSVTASNFESKNNKANSENISSSDRINTNKSVSDGITASSDISEINYLKSILKTPDEYPSENNIITKDVIISKKKKLSRWSLFAGAGISSSTYFSYNYLPESDASQRSLNTGFINGGIKYDASTKIRISVGASSLKISQERTGYNDIELIGTRGANGNKYNILTPTGMISGAAEDFDRTFFDSDSVLFPLIVVANPFVDDHEQLLFTLRQEFSYISIPVSIVYKLNRKIYTASAGALFNFNFLTGSELFLNDKKLDFDYIESPAKNTYSAGVIAGMDFHLLRRLDLFVNGEITHNINHLFESGTGDEPTMTRINTGFTYRTGF